MFSEIYNNFRRFSCVFFLLILVAIHLQLVTESKQFFHAMPFFIFLFLFCIKFLYSWSAATLFFCYFFSFLFNNRLVRSFLSISSHLFCVFYFPSSLFSLSLLEKTFPIQFISLAFVKMKKKRKQKQQEKIKGINWKTIVFKFILILFCENCQTD